MVILSIFSSFVWTRLTVWNVWTVIVIRFFCPHIGSSYMKENCSNSLDFYWTKTFMENVFFVPTNNAIVTCHECNDSQFSPFFATSLHSRMSINHWNYSTKGLHTNVFQETILFTRSSTDTSTSAAEPWAKRKTVLQVIWAVKILKWQLQPGI